MRCVIDWHIGRFRRSSSVLQLREPPDSVIEGAATYRILIEALAHYKNSAEVAKEELRQIRDELTTLKAERREFEQKSHVCFFVPSRCDWLNDVFPQAEANLKCDELNQLLAKRDADLVRIRESRDALQAEVHERKSKDADKQQSVHQIKTLATSRAASLFFHCVSLN